MKSRTIVLPIAFAMPAVLATVQESAPALASEPIVARQNPLLTELETVVADPHDASVLLAGHVAVVTGNPTLSRVTCRTKPNANVRLNQSAACHVKNKNALVRTGGHAPTPPPAQNTSPGTH